MSKLELSDPFPLRLPKDVLQDVARISEVCEKSRSWVILRALRFYLLGEGAEVLKAAEGMEQIRNGNYIDAEDLFRELDEIVNGDQTGRSD